MVPDVDDRMCFACGKENPISLALKFERISETEVEAKFTPQPIHQGYTGVIHGGILATLLDEAMAYAVGERGIKAFTAELNIRYKKPAQVGEKLVIKGVYKNSHLSRIARIHYTSAFIYDQSGNLKAKAEAKFVEGN
ncbi:PaaI family thioesterase [Halanaerobium salsuginis]|jgi:uncharacterized protein (TIGR00369 family)|uniref:Acyl-coenzyme A thioesterase THEM4 n=1 Tax=Halanaerobium salsuginis TaxID=29563 RepID=A0A1I4J3I2_9FIRM|nr:PaaI family thioesterase [Halanaerobium salsuginis]SFL60646.1 uncharacterized domain 1-containing protein [Halanaerobium salsuginis]